MGKYRFFDIILHICALGIGLSFLIGAIWGFDDDGVISNLGVSMHVLLFIFMVAFVIILIMYYMMSRAVQTTRARRFGTTAIINALIMLISVTILVLTEPSNWDYLWIILFALSVIAAVVTLNSFHREVSDPLLDDID
ncbi:MAG: hypothetical protein FWE38_05225 [Firmicutes bacterium]|nr:hypothetical protein [Bacillota bacterium]